MMDGLRIIGDRAPQQQNFYRLLLPTLVTGRFVRGAIITTALGVNHSMAGQYAASIAAKLRREGSVLLDSVKGPHGGYRLVWKFGSAR